MFDQGVGARLAHAFGGDDIGADRHDAAGQFGRDGLAVLAEIDIACQHRKIACDLAACGFDDGLLAALQVLRLMVERQRPLSELKRAMTRFPQVLLNVPVQARRDLDGVEPVQQTIARIRAALNDRGRVLVRYSGTEPLVRVMVEGEDGDTVQAYAEEVAAVILAELAN